MTSLPPGLAHHASRLDDVPQVRGAVAFGRAVAEKRERDEATAKWLSAPFPSGPTFMGVDWAEPGSDRTVEWAINRHAALAIGSAYRAQDRR